MLNSKFGSRQVANVIATENDRFGVNSSSSSATIDNGNNNSNQESYVIAKYDYDSQGPQELSIRKGDRLMLLDDSRHWWRVLNSDSLTGFVPSNYVKREKQSLFDSIRRGIRVNTKSKKSSTAQQFANHNNSDVAPVYPLIGKNTLSELPADSSTQFSSSKQLFEPNKSSDRKQPITNSDILVRELGPNFNNNCSSNILHKPSFNSNANDNCNNITAAASSAIISTAIIKYNYKSQQPDELSLTKGAKVSVLEKSDDGWWKGDLDGVIGWFPSNYVVEQASGDLNDEGQSNNNANSIIASNNKFTSPFKGASVQYNRQESSNTNNSQSDALFNTNNSVLQQPQQQDNFSLLPDSKSHKQIARQDHRNPGEAEEEVLFVVVALYSFQAQTSEELSFVKDERLDIIEKPINDPDWWRARNKSYEIGLVPKNYVQIVPGIKSIRTWTNSIDSNRQHAATDLSGGDEPTSAFNLVNNNKFGSTNINSSLDQSRNNNPSNGLLAESRQTSTMALTSSGTHRAEKQENISSSMRGSMPVTTNITTTATPAATTVESLVQSAHELAVKLNLNERVWYHGVMSRLQCDQLLNAYADDGDFLVRNSETSAGEFSVSLKAPMRNKHFRVHYVNEGFCIGQRTFATLDELVEHYKRTPIYTSASGEKMFLKKPYCR
uniref:Cytoplasmic protein NCK2 n=1 Tax=Aceria tosichella TaxID=561515 RepID=A0A6G1SIF7_9ACAR